MSNSLTYEVNGPVALLTLNRPDKLNAIDTTMMAEMNAAMDKAEEDQSIRAIVVKANGKSFSAGFDLDDEVWSSDKDEDIRAALQNDFDTIMRFWDSPKPTIACVQGYCLGGAMELALSCDLTVASTCAMFGEPEVSIASGIVVLNLPWLTGPKLAKEILFCADKRIPAQRIYEMGLINRVVEKEDLEFIQFFLSFFKIISLGNPAVTFGALILYPNKRKYLVKKAFIYDETGVFIIVSGYCILVRIYFSEKISTSHM